MLPDYYVTQVAATAAKILIFMPWSEFPHSMSKHLSHMDECLRRAVQWT